MIPVNPLGLTITYVRIGQAFSSTGEEPEILGNALGFLMTVSSDVMRRLVSWDRPLIDAGSTPQGPGT
jgi:hypothetical protein